MWSEMELTAPRSPACSGPPPRAPACRPLPGIVPAASPPEDNGTLYMVGWLVWFGLVWFGLVWFG